MNTPARIDLIEFDERYAVATVKMWRDSKAQALGIEEQHSFANHVEFLTKSLINDNSIFLAVDDTDQVAGFIATDGEFVNQLYIHPDYQRQGIGSRLLALAKDRSSGKLSLYTFEINPGAQRFYEKHGFRIIGRGSDNEEQLPDILYRWTSSPDHSED